MNLREGTRRLALFVGVIGLIIGGFFSYLELQAVLSKWAKYESFERLANTEVVKKERQKIQSQINAPSTNLPPGYTQDDIVPNPEYIPSPTYVTRDGVRIINWERGLRVYSIETDDGQTLYQTPLPAWWAYFLIVLLPILGFLIPWSLINAIVWVVFGFTQPSK